MQRFKSLVLACFIWDIRFIRGRALIYADKGDCEVNVFLVVEGALKGWDNNCLKLRSMAARFWISVNCPDTI